MMNSRVLSIFDEICSIPHGSHNTKSLAQFCQTFAENNGLDSFTDAYGNVIVKKPASPGFENHAPILLQSHLDMVCAKDPNVSFDFTKDHIETVVQGDWIYANGTSLGADDGIGLAMTLAILEDSTLDHPMLEALFTNDEEIGMLGVRGLDASPLLSKRCINIDSEEEGVFIVGCAGNTRATVSMPMTRKDNKLPCYRIRVSGLRGGHSGMEIAQGHSNAIRVMAKIISWVGPLLLVSMQGGDKDNAIPCYCEAVVAANRDPSLRLPSVLPSLYNENDPDLNVSIESCETSDYAYDEMATGMAFSLLQVVPNGVQSTVSGHSEQVQTSLNLGVLNTDNNSLNLTFLVRSSVKEDMTRLLSRIERVAKEHGASYTEQESCDPWEVRLHSDLVETMCRQYENDFHTAARVETIHAGVECGFLSAKIPSLDCVSFGPTVENAHTTKERVSISSVERMYNFLKHLLAKL